MSDHMDGAVELPRRHDLSPRRWQLPSGEIIGNAVNQEAIELLKSDPDEYFRRTRVSKLPKYKVEVKPLPKRVKNRRRWVSKRRGRYAGDQG